VYGAVKAHRAGEIGHYMADYALNAATGGAYGTVQAFNNGQTASGVVGALSLAVSAPQIVVAAYETISAVVSGNETVSTASGGETQLAGEEGIQTAQGRIRVTDPQEFTVSGRGGIIVEAEGRVELLLALGENESEPAAGVFTVYEVTAKGHAVFQRPTGFTLRPGELFKANVGWFEGVRFVDVRVITRSDVVMDGQLAGKFFVRGKPPVMPDKRL
jgi:hypothetical protein